MDAGQLEAIRTFWPVFASVVGALAVLGGVLWKVANLVSASVLRIAALEQAGRDRAPADLAREAEIKNRIRELHRRVDEHEELPGHREGEIRRGYMEEKLDELSKGMEFLKDAVTKLLAQEK